MVKYQFSKLRSGVRFSHPAQDCRSANTCSLFMKIFKLVLEIAVVIIVIWTLVISYQHLGFDKQVTFAYFFSEETNSFIVESSENASIHSVKWHIPQVDGWYEKHKNSRSLSIDELLFAVWTALRDKNIFIPPPDFNESTYGYLRCEILQAFDNYNSNTEFNFGFLAGVEIDYTPKGDSYGSTTDIVLITEFEDSIPQIRVIDTSVSREDLKKYMERGAARLNEILLKYSYDQNKTYIDTSGLCSNYSGAYTKHFFD